MTTMTVKSSSRLSKPRGQSCSQGEEGRGGVESTDSADAALTLICFWDGSCGLCDSGGLEHITRRKIHSDSAKLNTTQGEKRRFGQATCARGVLAGVEAIERETGIGSKRYLGGYENIVGW